MVGQPEELIFTINNIGETGFYFDWYYKDKFLRDYLQVAFKDIEGYVKSTSETYSVLRIVPVRNFSGRIVTISFKVRKYYV